MSQKEEFGGQTHEETALSDGGDSVLQRGLYQVLQSGLYYSYSSNTLEVRIWTSSCASVDLPQDVQLVPYQYEQGWRSLQETYGLHENIADQLDEQMIKLSPLEDPVDPKLLGKLQHYVHSIYNTIRAASKQESGLHKYDERTGLLTLASKLSPKFRQKWDYYSNDVIESTGNRKLGLANFEEY